MSNRNFILSEDNIKNLINAARASLHEELFPDAPAPEPLVFDGNYDMSLDDILVESVVVFHCTTQTAATGHYRLTL